MNKFKQHSIFCCLLVGTIMLLGGCVHGPDNGKINQSLAEDTENKIKQPNIILVFLDDASYGDFGITGSSTPTPIIDAFAKNGVQFTQFYHASSVCSASRVALLAGRYSDR